MLKGIRWLLLMGEETLDSPSRKAKRKDGDASDRQRLEDAMILNKPLATAYYFYSALSAF